MELDSIHTKIWKEKKKTTVSCWILSNTYYANQILYQEKENVLYAHSQAILLRKTLWVLNRNQTHNLIAGEMLKPLHYMDLDGEWRLHLCTEYM